MQERNRDSKQGHKIPSLTGDRLPPLRGVLKISPCKRVISLPASDFFAPFFYISSCKAFNKPTARDKIWFYLLAFSRSSFACKKLERSPECGDHKRKSGYDMKAWNLMLIIIHLDSFHFRLSISSIDCFEVLEPSCQTKCRIKKNSKLLTNKLIGAELNEFKILFL